MEEEVSPKKDVIGFATQVANDPLTAKTSIIKII